jgi:hypothetical protein
MLVEKVWRMEIGLGSWVGPSWRWRVPGCCPSEDAGRSVGRDGSDWDHLRYGDDELISSLRPFRLVVTRAKGPLALDCHSRYGESVQCKLRNSWKLAPVVVVPVI